MDRGRALRVSVWSLLIGVSAAVGAGAYWGWRNGKDSPFNPDPVPSAVPLVGLGLVAVVCLVVGIVVGLLVWLTPERD